MGLQDQYDPLNTNTTGKSVNSD